MTNPLERLRYHVSGAIERGEAEAIVGQPAPLGWITNDPEAAKALQKADRDYYRARIMAEGLTLGEKIVAYRLAKEVRQAAYDAVGAQP
jgi:hypothetical protein